MEIIIALSLLLLVSAAYAAHSAAPWVPTWNKDIQRIHKLLNLDANDKFVELGCGTARLSKYLSKNTQASIKGVELSLFHYFFAKLKTIFTSGKQFSVHYGNLFKINYSDQSAVYMFLMPEAYEKMSEKLNKELKVGSKVVSYVWPLPNWEPEKIDKKEGRADIYLYIKK